MVNKKQHQQKMKKVNQLLAVGGMAIMLCLGANQLLAQNNPGGGGNGGNGGNRGGGRNFDPAQFQQRMMDRYKEALEITDEAEWKVIQPLVQKVMDARMAVGFGGRGFMRGGNRSAAADTTQPAQPQRGGFGQPSPEAEALQKAIDAKASGAELKAALQKYQDSRKKKQADLEAAQGELRKVLTPRQEAIASLQGLT